MRSPPAGSCDLQHACLCETARAFAASPLLAWLPQGPLHRGLARASARLADRLARFDRETARDGLVAAARRGLAEWTDALCVSGIGHLPDRGPLVLAVNHPGLIDAVALLSCLSGHDIRILTARRPVLTALPALQRHTITIEDDPLGPRRALHRARRHLGHNGTLVIFPAGAIEPDPAHRGPAATRRLQTWSRSPALLAGGRCPALLLPVALSGVIAVRARAHPLARATRAPDARDWLAATCQALCPARYPIRPTLAFGRPVQGADIASRHQRLQAAMQALYLNPV